jgi:hypothetical protein
VSDMQALFRKNKRGFKQRGKASDYQSLRSNNL